MGSDEKLAKLAARVLEARDSLPRAEEDAVPQRIRIKNNSGTINFGTLLNIGHPPRAAESALREQSSETLQGWLTEYRAQWWSGCRGYWFNIPCLALLGLLLGIGSSLYAGVLPIREPQSMWMVLAPCLLAIAGLSFWLMNIRRIEGNLMAESQAAMDEIRTELRRRR